MPVSPGFPFLVSPQISDRLRRTWPPSFLSEFRALQFSLMLCAFVGALGGAAFLGTAIFIEGDRRWAQLHVQGQLGLPLFTRSSLPSFVHHLPSPVCLALPSPQPSPSGLPSQQADGLACPQLGAPSISHYLFVPSLALCLSVHPTLALTPPLPGLLREAGPEDDRIVVPQRGRSTRVPVSSVLI